MSTEFSRMDLHPQLVQAVLELGYETPTPIQSAVIPVMLSGQDVIGQAQTGTGKTAAFALPILNAIDPNQGTIQALVMAPTRELASQVSNAIHDYGRLNGVSVMPIYGGQSYDKQLRRLKRGVNVVVGTPGRMLDLIKRKSLKLHDVRTVVLDEADEMLSMGFVEDIEKILQQTPATRQTALFSATMPAPIRRLAQRYMHDPQTITVERKHLTVESIDQRHYIVNEKDKLAAISRLLEIEPISQALIFARTRIGTGKLASALVARGYPAEVLNGELSQDAREQVLKRFRQHKIKLLVATDVAARGLDIDDISHVINYDLPLDEEAYVHRIGRTGRIGKSGTALSLVTPGETRRLRRIEHYIKQKITAAPLPSIEDVIAKREGMLLERMMVWLRRDRCHQEREIVQGLVEDGYDPLDVAAAALKLARVEEKQRPLQRIREVQPDSVQNYSRHAKQRRGKKSSRKQSSPRGGNGNSRGSHEAGMVRLSMGKGKADGVRPNDVVGTIAHHADIPGSKIGRIMIREKHTLVDVPDRFVAQVLAKNGAYQIHKQSIRLEVA